MRATRLVFVFLLSSLLLAPPVSSAQGKGNGQGRGGNERVERVEKDRGGKKDRGHRVERARDDDRRKGKKSRAARVERRDDRDDRDDRRHARGNDRRDRRELRERAERAQQARERDRDRDRDRDRRLRDRQRSELREQRQRAEVRQRQAEIREQRQRAEIRQRQRQVELREQRRLAEIREQRRVEQRLRERERSRLNRMVTSVRDRRDDDRRETRVRFRDRDRFRAPAQMRFRGLDRDGDGRIARHEWRGNQVSFRNHDWNRDGILSGAEVTPGARKPRRFDRFDDRVRVVRREVRLDPIFTFRSDPFGHRVVLPPPRLVSRVDQVFLSPPSFQPLRPVRSVRRVAPIDDVMLIDLGVNLDQPLGLLALPATLMLADALVDDVDVVVRSGRFAAYDSDLDGYVTPVEWPAGRRSFRSYDRDDDLLLVRDELFYDDDLVVVDRDRFLLFHGLDRDDDGLIEPWEWPGDVESFFLRDFNGDAVIGLDEFMGLVEVDHGVRSYGYDALDFDRSGTIAGVEWVGDPVRFSRLDRNANGVVGRWEYGVGWMLDV